MTAARDCAVASPGAKRRGRVVPIAVVVGLGLLLGACGFRPLYGSRGATADNSEKLAQVEIGVIDDRRGQQLRNLLIDRFYGSTRPTRPAYRLETVLRLEKGGVGLQKDATTTRYKMTVSANYQMTDLTTQQVVFRSASESVVNYNVLQAQFATFATEQDAIDRGLEQLGDEITTRVALFLDRS
ncbi:MAG: hypothetical protein GC191_10030 [Azospirillum sp.]|nr:hypothetical protein [Azospirillum sp.]